MAEYMPLFQPGQVVTYHATGTIAAGQLVALSGTAPGNGLPPVAVATGPTTRPIGVATRDAAAGQEVGVWTGGVHELTATGAVPQGATVAAAAAGAVAASTGTDVIVGVAELAIADGAKGRVRLFV